MTTNLQRFDLMPCAQVSSRQAHVAAAEKMLVAERGKMADMTKGINALKVGVCGHASCVRVWVCACIRARVCVRTHMHGTRVCLSTMLTTLLALMHSCTEPCPHPSPPCSHPSSHPILPFPPPSSLSPTRPARPADPGVAAGHDREAAGG